MAPRNEVTPPSDDLEGLLARLAAMEPARGTPALSASTIHTLIYSATAPHREARPWTWARLQLASAGALLCTGALVVAGILGMDAAGTPVSLAGSARLTPVHPPLAAPAHPYAFQVVARGDIAMASSKAVSMSGYCPVALQLRVRATKTTSVAPHHAGAFEIASAQPPLKALSALAPPLGLSATRVMWFPATAHEKAWWVGRLRGPSLTTFSAAGITWWSYVGPRESSAQLRHDAGAKGRHLPSVASASRRAVALLARLGIAGHLGRPRASRSASTVEVAVPITASGLASDEGFDVTYGPSGRLLAAAGPLVALGREVAYPVISSARATQLLRRPFGALLGLAAPTAAATEHPPAARRPTPTAVCGVPQGVLDVTSAMLTLRTKELSDGRVWLLPSWTFSARPDGMVDLATNGTATSLVAISPRFLVYGPAEVRFRHHTRGG